MSFELSTRERQLIDLASKGCTDKEISVRLGLALPTVRTHWVRVRQKTGAANRSQAVADVLRKIGTEQRGEAHRAIEEAREAHVGMWVWQSINRRALLDEASRKVFGLDSECVSVEALMSAIWPADRERMSVYLYQSRTIRPMVPIECRVNSGLSFGNVIRTTNLGARNTPRSGPQVLLASTIERALLV